MRETVYKKYLWFGIGAIIVFSPIARGAVKLWSITPVLLIEFILIFLWFWKMNNSWHGLVRTKLDLPILLFSVLAIISFVFSIYKHASLYALARLFGYIGIYYIVVNEFDEDMIKKLLMLVICIGTSLSVYGLMQYFGFLSHSWWVPNNFLASTYVNHNHFAGYLELILPVAIGMLMQRSSIRSSRSARQNTRGRLLNRLGLVIALVVMIAAFVLTQSRGGWASLAIALLFMMFWMARREPRNKKYILILILMTGSIISFVYFAKDVILQRIEALTNTEIRETSLDCRMKIWNGTIAMIRERPFIGTGIGTFILGFSRYRPEGLNVRANFAHNEYLQTASEMGIFAPVIIILIFAMLIGIGMGNRNYSPAYLGCAIGILSLAIHGVVDFNFHIPANMILLSLYAAIVVKTSIITKETK